MVEEEKQQEKVEKPEKADKYAMATIATQTASVITIDGEVVTSDEAILHLLKEVEAIRKVL